MSIPQQPYASTVATTKKRGTFIPRIAKSAFIADGMVGAAPAGGGLNAMIGGIAAPLLCFGCLAAMGLLGLFGTMIGAAAYMSAIQSEVRRRFGAGTTIEYNYIVLFSALLCSIYMLLKHRQGAISS